MDRMLAFLDSSPDVFLRSHAPGHFTGSALIVDAQMQRVALTHHRKLNRWLQFGGHADGDPDLALVALKEGEEESALPDLKFYPIYEGWEGPPLPVDLDIHEIPPHGPDPAHLHYDVRFLLWTDQPQRLQASFESKQVAWFPLEEAHGCSSEMSMHRQFRKIEAIRERLRATR